MSDPEELHVPRATPPAAINTGRCPTTHSGDSPAPTVEDRMLRAPQLWCPDTTVDNARAAFTDDHLHALLIVEDRVLLAVVERHDLHGAAPSRPAHTLGRLAERTVTADALLVTAHRRMLAANRRRLAVVNDRTLLGLLCLKRSGLGFCSDASVAARANDRPECP